jgi:GDP-L-fucose synthase
VKQDTKWPYKGLGMPELGPIPRDAKIYVAGHRGLVGSAIWRLLEKEGFTDLIGKTSSQLDLRDANTVEQFFQDEKPEYVFLAAAKVGGIMANNSYPADFISDNLRIQVNVIDSARRNAVRRLLFLGSSCIYPKYAEQPIREDSLLTGALEPTNDAYAVAKIAGILQIQANRRQYGSSFISAMPTNLYGPGDNFDLQTSHVLPALIRKMHEAKTRGDEAVTIWGSGTPYREFLHSNDLAAACLFLMENYDDPKPINIGVGEDLSIRQLAEAIAQVVGYQGKLEFDSTKPDGAPKKLLNITKLQSLGWKHKIGLVSGLRMTYEEFKTLSQIT